MNTATFVRQRNGTGEGRVFRVDPPVSWSAYRGDKRVTHTSRYVWVSAVVAMFTGPETYIFPCTSKGVVKGWGELPGSSRGDLDIDKALRDAGYEPVYAKKQKKEVPPVEKIAGRYIERREK